MAENYILYDKILCGSIIPYYGNSIILFMAIEVKVLVRRVMVIYLFGCGAVNVEYFQFKLLISITEVYIVFYYFQVVLLLY